jgi:hypothetical protein
VVVELLGVLGQGLLVGGVEQAGLGLGVAAELPGEQGDALGEEVLEGGLGGQVVADGVEEEGEGVALGGGDEG